SLSEYLKQHYEGIRISWTGIRKYHGDMPRQQKEDVLRDVLHDGYEVLIATKAFGMGIDKENIHLIIHYDVPESIEEYAQEIGRAARGGGKADCYILCAKGSKGKKNKQSNEDRKREKEQEPYGSIAKTDKITKSMQNILALEKKPILSCLSEKSKDYFREMTIYRFDQVRKMLDLLKSGSDDNDDDRAEKSERAHEYIQNYLQQDLYALPFGKGGTDFIIDDIKEVLRSTYMLYINNTGIANRLRHKPESYSLGEPCTIKVDEWRREKARNLQNIHIDDIDKDTLFVLIEAEDPSDFIDETNDIIQEWIKKHTEPECILIIEARNKVTAVCKQNGSGKWEPAPDSDPDYSKYMGRIAKIPNITKQLKKLIKENKTEEEKKHAPNRKPIVLTAFVEGRRNWEALFKLEAKSKPDYWDMCVADAVYSIMRRGKDVIYVKDIWAVLTGNRDFKFPRKNSNIKEAIEMSLKKLMDTKIEIRHSSAGKPLAEGFELSFSGAFLPLKVQEEKETGYRYSAIPPLYEYAERLRQMIQIPISYLDMCGGDKPVRYKPKPLFLYSKEKAVPYDSGKEYLISEQKELEITVEKQIYEIKNLRKGDGPNLALQLTIAERDSDIALAKENIIVQSIQWQASQKLEMLCHFLIHRSLVAHRKSRGNMINLKNLRDLFPGFFTDRELNNSGLLYRKIIAIMCYYQRIKLIQFVGYIKDFPLCDQNGKITMVTAYFKIRHCPAIEYWHDGDNCYFQPKDIHLTWVETSETNRNMMKKANKNQYSEETISKIDKISITDLTGLKLLYIRN
nr:hypothetical protein [Lachnospiraceae bacterium]